MDRADLDLVAGGGTLRFRFKDIPLVEGQYYVTVAVHPRVGPEYHRLDRTATLQASISDAGEDGVLHLTPRGSRSSQ